MCGHLAARSALRQVFGRRRPSLTLPAAGAVAV
jgi:hypothetical protein